MKKRVLLLVMAMCLLFNVCGTLIYAEGVTPRWVNTNYVTTSLNFLEDTGYIAVKINGDSGVENITATVTLYHKSGNGWFEVTHWDYDVDDMTLAINETFDGVSSRTYKFIVEMSVTKDGYSESITKSSSEKTCP